MTATAVTMAAARKACVTKCGRHIDQGRGAASPGEPLPQSEAQEYAAPARILPKP